MHNDKETLQYQLEDAARNHPTRFTEPPMLTARGILVSCVIPAFFFALLNVFFLSDSILQALSALVGTFLEVKQVEIAGVELGLTSQGVAFLAIALLWGIFIWLNRYPILTLYSVPVRVPLIHRFKWLNKQIARLLPMPAGQLATLSRMSDDAINFRYGLDPSLVWPRLVSLAPNNYLQELRSSDIFLHFFLNLSISAYVLAVEALVALIWLGNLSLAIIGIVSLGLCYGFYVAAVPVMGLRLLRVQTGFDLFRMDLLKQMRIPSPKTLEEELGTWAIVHSLLRADPDLDPSLVEYVASDNEKT